MNDDPRRILEEAAERRVALELLPRAGGVRRATVVRVERGGVVVTVAERVGAGEDVRAWFSLDGQTYAFEASVIRAGVPVPDRGHNGLMLGFIARWTRGDGAAADQVGRVLALVPPNGPGISLLVDPARVLHLAIDAMQFTLPSDFRMVWVDQGRVRLRMAMPGLDPVEVEGRVRALSTGGGYLLYDVHFEATEDPERLRQVVRALANTL